MDYGHLGVSQTANTSRIVLKQGLRWGDAQCVVTVGLRLGLGYVESVQSAGCPCTASKIANPNRALSRTLTLAGLASGLALGPF